MARSSAFGDDAARDWLTLPGAPRGKDLAEMAGLDRDSKEARNFIRAIQLFTTETGKRQNQGMSDRTRELVAEAASGSMLSLLGTVVLPRDSKPKNQTEKDHEERDIRMDLDPVTAVRDGYNAAYIEALEEALGQAFDLIENTPYVDPGSIDWQL